MPSRSMLGLSRNIAAAHQSLQQGRWDRKSYMGTQLADKTLGIVGLGRIGQEVAQRAKAFRMRVLGYDPFLSSEQANKLGIEKRGDRAGYAAAGRLPDRPHPADPGHPASDRRRRDRAAQARCAADQRGARRHLRRSGAGRGTAAAANWAGSRWTSSKPSRARTARCFSCPACSARPTWAPARKKRKPRSPWRPYSCWSGS